MISGTTQRAEPPRAGRLVAFVPVLSGPGKARRARREPFRASREVKGPYGLPFGLRDALERDLQPYRNREDAYTLAVFLARFWSSPVKLGQCFPVCRVELAAVASLGLTEARVRGAVKTLEAVRYLRRKVQLGTGFKRPDFVRGARRAPALFEFGLAYLEGFTAANKRAARERAKRSGVAPVVLKSPVRTESEAKEVLTGELVKRRPLSDASFSRSDGPLVRTPEGQAYLEAVLARAGRGIR